MHYKMLKILIGACSFMILFLLQAVDAHAIAVQQDSVGLEKKEGEVFILHQVERKETLFSISRRYGVHVNELKSSNPEVDVDELKIGDILRVPMFPELFRGKKAHHVVREGETLFRIARKYGVSVEEIRRWNAIGNQALPIGQELIIYLEKPDSDPLRVSPEMEKYVTHKVQEGETLYAISKAFGVSTDSLRRLNHLPDESISIGQTLLIREKKNENVPATEVKKVPEPGKPKVSGSKAEGGGEDDEFMFENEREGRKLTRAEALEKEKERIKKIREEEKKALSEYEKVTQIGFAAAISGNSQTKKFLALHRTAPVGTILQVRNEMNNLSVFVRVVGKLPDTGINNKIDIRISQSAYEKLGGINERFPVEITYLK